MHRWLPHFEKKKLKNFEGIERRKSYTGGLYISWP
jgi:hypothetical protein